MIVAMNNLAPPQELVDFAERHVRNASRYDSREGRSKRRHFIVVPVLALPVDQQFRPAGALRAMVTRDITPKGIGLVHSQPLEEELLALQMVLAGEEVNVVVAIDWTKPLGPFELSGGGFVAKLPRLPREAMSHDATPTDPAGPAKRSTDRSATGRRQAPTAVAP